MTLHDLLKPELRLFLSVDVQDSTAFKQQADSHDSSPWRGYFGAFLRDFPSELEAHLNPAAPAPEVWKFLGDEIVFSLLLRKPRDAAEAMRAFCDAVASYEPDMTKPRQLRLKGSAWVAGFPAGNAIVPANDGRFDYIGPAMDTGFRLGKMATRRKFAVSVELAWLLLQLPPAQRRNLPLYFDGRCQLKGVMERDGYPFIWTDLFHNKAEGLVTAEDQLKPPPATKAVALRRFCELYIRAHGEPRWVPFIAGVFDKRTTTEIKLYENDLVEVRALTRRLWPELEIASAAKRRRRPASSLERQKVEDIRRWISDLPGDPK